MAFRWLQSTGGVLLVAMLAGAGCAQGSGSHTLTGQAPVVEVLGAVEERASTAPGPSVEASTSTRTPVPSTAPAPAEPTTAPSPVPTTTTARTPAPAATAPPAIEAAAATPATTEPPAAEPEPAAEDDIGTRTLARISYPWREKLPGWQIDFLPGRAGLRGLTLPATRRIEIYVRSSDTPSTLARVVAHELGHAVDVARNDASDRARWRAARGAEATVPWWPEAAVTDFATLAGDFAEAFAVWQVGATSQSTVAGAPTEDQLALLASLAS